MLTIDGVEYDVKCEIVRTAKISASDISGLMLDKTYFNDVLGTFMEYEIAFTHPLYRQGTYSEIYEALTKPVPYHTFELPYNQATVQLTARVEVVEDEFVKLENGMVFWKNLSFVVISSAPTKTMSLTEAISNGLPPYPPVENPDVGDAYQYFDDGWEEIDGLPDADGIAY